jgi:hypothetical protein
MVVIPALFPAPGMLGRIYNQIVSSPRGWGLHGGSRRFDRFAGNDFRMESTSVRESRFGESIEGKIRD